jgi:dihydropteroate synthase
MLENPPSHQRLTSLPYDRTLVMGILNVTPDSFSDGGRFVDAERAVAHALAMVEEGADIIDLGGESTRPGHSPVTVEEELRRILPVLERLAPVSPVPISIDTTKAEVARRAVALGAALINDQQGLHGESDMAAVAAELDVPVIAMHNQRGTAYDDLLPDIITWLRRSLERADEVGLGRGRVIVDPGFGFGKTPAQNLEMLRRLGELRTLERPILIGTSRKSMIARVLPGLSPAERTEGTAATVALGIAFGADIVRVHDVPAMTNVARMTDAVVRQLHAGASAA